MTQLFIAQSIVRKPYFWGTALRMAIITDSVSHTKSVNNRVDLHRIISQLFQNNLTTDIIVILFKRKGAHSVWLARN